MSASTSTACGYEGVSVWAFEQDQRGTKTVSGSVYVDYYAYDFCTGTDRWGWAVLDGASFAQQRLSSASLNASATISVQSCTYTSGGGSDAGMGGSGGGYAGSGGKLDPAADGGVGYGYYTCTSSDLPLSIALAWTGTGDTFRDRSTMTYSTPHSRYTSRSSSQSRDAVLGGSMSLGGNGVDLSNAYGSLSIQSSGYFDMYH